MVKNIPSYSSSELKGFNRCGFKRSRSLKLGKNKNSENVYTKSVLIKNAIRQGLFKVADEDEIEASLEISFADLDYPTKETAKLHAADAFRQVMRYVSCEDRIPEEASMKTVSPFGLMDVRIKPDYVFRGIKDFEYVQTIGKKKEKYTIPKKYIEVVKIKCSKPDVSITGKNKDSGMMRNLELYSMLLYARSLVKPGESMCVCASYYYLGKRNDNSITKEFDKDFFNNKGAGNVVTLWEDYTPGIHTEIDAAFKPQFEEFLKGEEADENICENCEYYDLCHFTLPPEKSETEVFASAPISKIKLTDSQEKVVDFKTGIACVNAGAGSGKTTCIALRTAKLISDGVSPEKICMLTFTDAGADEMKTRIRRYAKELKCKADASKITSTTFNAFGYDIVKENYEELGFSNMPVLIDDIKKSSIIAELLSEKRVADLDYKNFYSTLPGCKGALSVTKKAFETIKSKKLQDLSANEAYIEMPSNIKSFMTRDSMSDLLELYKKYDDILKTNSLIEYADQELLVFKTLEMHPDYFTKRGYEHIIIDEFQDTNEIQFELIKKLIDTPSFKSLMVVGDDSQSIFAFRGSDPRYIINFFKYIGRTGTCFNITENHRSTPEILNFANKINSLNKDKVDKDLNPVKAHGKAVSVNVFWKRNEDTEYALDTIKTLIGSGRAYEDIAYIAYTRTELINMGTILTENNIPWIMLNPEPMLENSRVRSAIALAKFINDGEDTLDALKYINAVHKGKVFELSDDDIRKEISDLDSKVESIIDVPEAEACAMFKTMLENIACEDEIYEKFVSMVLSQPDLDSMIKYCIMFEIYGADQSCKREADYPGVVLTTAHSSKGKEWPVVINNLSRYHIKEIGSNINSSDFQERRRLLFVSATRAKEELYICRQALAYG